MTTRLATPDKLRRLQRKLYAKAKAEPAFRFYSLHDKIARSDVLAHAYAVAKANGGVSGVDGESFAAIEASGLESWLAGLAQELEDGTYRPKPVRRVLIPKPDGGQRPLSIPTVRDRVAQTAAKLILEPIFEADLEPNAYGYRPKRRATDGVREVHRLLLAGYTDVVDSDLSQYFDEIPHRELLHSVAQRVVDRAVLRLIKRWLKAPVVERTQRGRCMVISGHKRQKGTPQGGVLSPLLANLYMNRLLKYWRRSGCRDRLKAHIIAYADDLVILSRGHAIEAMTRLRSVMLRLGLTVNEAKTAVVDARQQQFHFLGYALGAHYSRVDGHWYLGASPSKKSIQRVKANVSALLVPSNTGSWREVRYRLNRLLRGWSGYFCYGSRSVAYRAVDHHVEDRARYFLRRRHKVATRATRRFAEQQLFGELGVVRLEGARRAAGRMP